MNYELCKKLKDAGFPQPPVQNEMAVGYGWCLVPPEEQERGLDKFYYSPSLSELIEACGSNLYSLESDCEDGKIRSWRAVARWITKSWPASTPEEAVANLWLTLQVKE